MAEMDYSLIQRNPDGTGKILVTTPGIPDLGSYVTENDMLNFIATRTITKGYLYNGVFYEDSQHTTAMTGDGRFVYLDLTTLGLYAWDGSAYVWLMPTNVLKTSDVVDSTSSTSTTAPLSANQGKVMQQEIDALKARGRFLSLWDGSTGLPISFPLSIPYSYQSGDYYIVSVTGTTNYAPSGSSYTGSASTSLESDFVNVNDTYYYDGTRWMLQKNSGNDIHLSVENGQICVTFTVEDYDSTVNYVVGDYCWENGQPYICTKATTGTFNPSDWRAF